MPSSDPSSDPPTVPTPRRANNEPFDPFDPFCPFENPDHLIKNTHTYMFLIPLQLICSFAIAVSRIDPVCGEQCLATARKLASAYFAWVGGGVTSQEHEIITVTRAVVAAIRGPEVGGAEGYRGEDNTESRIVHAMSVYMKAVARDLADSKAAVDNIAAR